MNAHNKSALAIAFAVLLFLLMMFGGGTMSGETLSNDTMGTGMMSGISWIWIPAVLILGLGALVVWAIFERKK